MKVAIYVRVSTSEQSTEAQEKTLAEYVAARGWTVYAVYRDHGISGATRSRPALDELMAGARKRSFDAVLVWKFDRFARSISHLVDALDEFQALRIAFISHTEAADTTTPSGKMLFTVIGAMAEMERGLIRERVNLGLKRAKEKGTRLGRPPAANPYNREKVSELAAAGLSIRQIGKKLELSSSVVHRLLKAVPKTPLKPAP